MTYMKQMQGLVSEYRTAGNPWPTTAKTIADWALREKRWELPSAAIRRRCADDIASAMREEYLVDGKGRKVRRLHPAPVEYAGQKEMVWDDIRTAPRDHMQMSFQHRRHGIVGDCRQMKIDVDSYNDAHSKEEQIEIVFNFEMDLAELEAAD